MYNYVYYICICILYECIILLCSYNYLVKLQWVVDVDTYFDYLPTISSYLTLHHGVDA